VSERTRNHVSIAALISPSRKRSHTGVAVVHGAARNSLKPMVPRSRHVGVLAAGQSASAAGLLRAARGKRAVRRMNSHVANGRFGVHRLAPASIHSSSMRYRLPTSGSARCAFAPAKCS